MSRQLASEQRAPLRSGTCHGCDLEPMCLSARSHAKCWGIYGAPRGAVNNCSRPSRTAGQQGDYLVMGQARLSNALVGAGCRLRPCMTVGRLPAVSTPELRKLFLIRTCPHGPIRYSVHARHHLRTRHQLLGQPRKEQQPTMTMPVVYSHSCDRRPRIEGQQEYSALLYAERKPPSQLGGDGFARPDKLGRNLVRQSLCTTCTPRLISLDARFGARLEATPPLTHPLRA